MKKLKVKAKDDGRRLDSWLAESLEISRNKVQKLIKESLVANSEHILHAHHLVRNGEVITISESIKKIAKKTKAAIPKIQVIKETKDYFVINKPAGLLMHGTENEERSSVVDWLLDQDPKIAKVGEDPSRPGIVHRIDKDVSGLVVLAKNQDSFDDLKNQFQKRTILKQYQALVYGEDLPEEGEIRFKLDRSAKGYRMAARPENQEGKRAITNFTIIHHYFNYTLVLVTIKTGRTHQIRAHFAAYNHPLVGDDLYGTTKDKLQNKKIKLGRVFLVATHLAFTDLAGKRQEFSIPLPKQLTEVLKNLKIKK